MRNILTTNDNWHRLLFASALVVALGLMNTYSWIQGISKHISIQDITTRNQEYVGKTTSISNLRVISVDDNQIIATKQSDQITVNVSSSTEGDTNVAPGQRIHSSGIISPEFTLNASEIRYDRIPTSIKFLASIIALIGTFVMLTTHYRWNPQTKTLERNTSNA